MISLIYIYNVAINSYSSETANFLGMFFIAFIIIFLILNFIVVLLHKIYNVDVSDSLKEYFVDINDIDFSDKKIFELACLKDSRLPNERDVFTMLFGLVNKKHLKLSKKYDKYYIERNDKLNIDNISSSELLLLDLIENEKVDLKYFVKKISNKYASKKIVNKMREEIFEKFDYFEVNTNLIVVFNFLKITMIVAFVLFSAFWLFIASQNVEYYSGTLLMSIPEIFLNLYNLLLIVIFIFTLTYCCGYVKKLNDILFNKEKNVKFLVVIGIVLIAFMVLFLINKVIAIFCIYVYITGLIINLSEKKYFLNVKKGYLKDKIEAISLEKYIREYSNLKERDSQSIIIYEEYFSYAFAFEITLKVNDELDLNNILFNELIKVSFKQNMRIFGDLRRYTINRYKE